MGILIDGYNFLFTVGLAAEHVGPGTLARSRAALLNFVFKVVEPRELSRTVIIYDAANSPPGLPSEERHRGIRVLFAVKHDDADTLIEELIASDHSPRQLTVVSSDHRLQRAARRRRADPIDSDRWYRESLDRVRRLKDADPAEIKPMAPLSEAEVQGWLDEFGPLDIESLESDDKTFHRMPAGQDFPPSIASPSTPANKTPSPKGRTRKSGPSNAEADKPESGYFNPFPPGYGEDLL